MGNCTGKKNKKKKLAKTALLSPGTSQQEDILYHLLVKDKMMLFEKSQGFFSPPFEIACR